mmetsp:Transcript_7337/g.18805  ORF Transcript_7337/g.18805 Transcript_7337/m.18805 type:complete len:792 (+) Transcript_7337:240-2615(+)
MTRRAAAEEDEQGWQHRVATAHTNDSGHYEGGGSLVMFLDPVGMPDADIDVDELADPFVVAVEDAGGVLDTAAEASSSSAGSAFTDHEQAQTPRKEDEDEDCVVTMIDDLVIKSYPDGSTVVIRPDGTELRRSESGNVGIVAAPQRCAATLPVRTVSPSFDEDEPPVAPSYTSDGTCAEGFAVPNYVAESEDSDTGSFPEDYGSDVENDDGDVLPGVKEWELSTSFLSGDVHPTILSPTTATGPAVAQAAGAAASSQSPALPWETPTKVVSAAEVKRCPSGPVSSGCPFHSGWLFKEGGTYKTWKRRWFELYESGQLLYYDKEQDLGGKFINSVDVTRAIVAANPHSKRPFGLVVQTASDLTGVSNKRSKYILAASNTRDRDRWLTSLQMSATHSDESDLYPASFTTLAGPRSVVVGRATGTTGSGTAEGGPREDSSSSVGLTKPPTRSLSRKIRWNPTYKMRALVSKNKLRFQEKGPSGHQYDLDLGYITERVIGMGYPSDGTEGLYRNKWEEVKSFLEDFHPRRYRVYNLCSERAYPAQRFRSRVALFPFDDHGVPPLSLIQQCCDDMARWLDADDHNVCAVHCKAGKGRTGLVISSFLLHTGTVRTAKEALEMYGTQRCADARGVTLPSQIRYVEYYARFLTEPLKDIRRLLARMVVTAIPHESGAHGVLPYYVAIEEDGELVWTSKDDLMTVPDDTGHGVVDLALDPCVEVSGDVAVRLMQVDNFGSDNNVCTACFNVSFTVGSRLDFDKAHLDNPYKHKLLKRAEANFGFAISFRTARVDHKTIHE